MTYYELNTCIKNIKDAIDNLEIVHHQLNTEKVKHWVEELKYLSSELDRKIKTQKK